MPGLLSSTSLSSLLQDTQMLVAELCRDDVLSDLPSKLPAASGRGSAEAKGTFERQQEVLGATRSTAGAWSQAPTSQDKTTSVLNHISSHQQQK